MDLTLQTNIDGQWHPAAVLEFTEPELGTAGACLFEYDFDYVADWIGADAPFACVSLGFPIELGPRSLRRWPAFLDDLRPMGSARRWWMNRLALKPEPASEIAILRAGTIAPIGNLRIAESVPLKEGPPRRFPRQSVIDREQSFLEYASDLGAQVGGATGAGGDSPKILVRQDDAERIWIDVWQDEPTLRDRHYLVKFARGRTELDRLILRSEYFYYRALQALEIDTVAAEGLALEEGPSGPSLWIPRFDVGWREGHEVRWGLESIYSLVGGQPGAFLTHQRALMALREVIRPAAWRDVLLEYLRRDLLNLVFGNPDNHGRNMAVLKTDCAVQLAPVFDFAPMKMDPEGIIRTTRWESFERGGEIDWPGLLQSFGTDEPFLREGLRSLAERLRKLPELLASIGLPRETLEFEPLALRNTERRLRKWTLL